MYGDDKCHGKSGASRSRSTPLLVLMLSSTSQGGPGGWEIASSITLNEYTALSSGHWGHHLRTILRSDVGCRSKGGDMYAKSGDPRLNAARS